MLEKSLLGMVFCALLGCLFILISAADRNTRSARRDNTHKCDWLFDGENGSKTGAFFKCKKCGRNKYIPYKELMEMPEDEYIYWTTRESTNELKYRK